MPTEVGTQTIFSMLNVEIVWIPACAGMTARIKRLPAASRE
jgi:hypothetical protein